MQWDSRKLRLLLLRQGGHTVEMPMKLGPALRMRRPTMGIWLPTLDQWLGPHWCLGNLWIRIFLHFMMRIWNLVQARNGHLDFSSLIFPWHMMSLFQRVARWDLNPSFNKAIVLCIWSISFYVYCPSKDNLGWVHLTLFNHLAFQEHRLLHQNETVLDYV